MTLTAQKGALRVSGTISVPGTTFVTVSMPDGGWLDTSKFEVSNDYNNAYHTGFDTGKVCAGAVRPCVYRQNSGHIFRSAFSILPKSDVTATAIYTDTTQTEQKTAVTLGSYNSPIYKVLAKNCVGNTVTIRLSKKDGANGFTQSEDYTLQLDRMPTLAALLVTAGGAGTGGEGDLRT